MLTIRKSKPAINWNDPINVGLCVAWSPELPYRNLVTNNTFADASGGTALLVSANKAGIGCQELPSPGYNQIWRGSDGPTSKTELTILSVNAIAPNAGDIEQQIVNLGDGTVGNGNYVIHSVTGAGSSRMFRSQIYTSSYQILSSAVPVDVGSGTAHVMITVNSVSGSRRENWLDGNISTAGTAVTSGSANLNFVTLFNNSNTANMFPATCCVNLILIWNRALNVAELIRVSAVPRAGFLPRIVHIPFNYTAQPSAGTARPVVFTAM